MMSEIMKRVTTASINLRAASETIFFLLYLGYFARLELD
jgi:hypothetical protein